MMALENNLVVDSDAELKAFLSSILSSEGNCCEHQSNFYCLQQRHEPQ